jgi:predicted metal-dependent phosphoesterase TrpH
MSELLVPPLEYLPFDAERPGSGWRLLPAARIDLHCHSTFSKERSRYLRGLVYRPLMEPQELYDLAKARGMSFVTITDHDSIEGCLALLDRHGDLPDFIIGEEVSAAFPQDGTVVHVNVYDHDEAQHREIQRLRGNIYELVDYLRHIDKLFVLNHLTWTARNRVLAVWQIEALLELFDVLEGLNGTRSYSHNVFAWQVARGRGKVLVAGSDSHTRRVGTTYTITTGSDRTEVLANIRAGRAAPAGAFGTAEQMREDVRLVLQKNMERRLAEASRYWERWACRVVRGLGKLVYPAVCFGYELRQMMLVRGFARTFAELGVAAGG